jgi:predicted nucleic acid-binding protein
LLPRLSGTPGTSKKVPYPPDDLDDVPFLHAALDGTAKVLVSGDSHLLDLNGKYHFPIVSPAEFLKKY